ncbi:UBA/TSN domain containing protein [Acanthamoeba castellanii str. Neff]|uniref:UBA/TSN domain containing protein n=1 Tax=Acanthamoeba castellanii (strain ATCC 30010 / Neff) TaxID=1257118 RepID=L8GWQ2_ACACF|nr:UBA/TSN domain containing protein [Acanthamoeba castellanii str. Neff]ELR17377.1 UBA/TSN domain containing protein [Acanthamoeba castellanii str. Neff]
MFEDEEDYSLSAFSTSGGRGAGGRRTLSRPAEPRPSDGFVGLLNQGATCYLNSLIQALYMTPELRAGLFDLSLDDLQVVTTAPSPPVAATAPESDDAAATTEQDPDKREEPAPSGEDHQAKTEHATAPAVEPATTATQLTTEKVVEVVKEKESWEGAAAGGAAGEVAGDDDPRAFLASMGFEEAQVRRALARFSNDTARAVEWLLSGGGGAAAAEDDGEGDNDDGFGGLAGMASTLQERDTEDAETDISGFGEQDPFGEGELFEGAADAFGSAEDDEEEEEEDSEERRAREAEEQAARDKAEREEKEWKEREQARKEKQQQEWSCHLCTFLNHPAKMFCGVCETRRQQPDAAAAAKATAGGHTVDGQTEQAAAAANGSGGDAAEEIVKNQQGEQVIVKKRKIPMELQRLFARMQAADVDAVSTESLTESFGWQGREMFEQQDVHELNRVLFDAIERSLKNTPACNLISDLYKGVTVNQIVCTNCKNVSEREEPFQDVTLTVAGLGSVTASLAAATEYEMLTGDNRYNCENCGQRVDALKGAVFRSLPPILILSLSRFTYDVERDGRVKVGDKFAFPLLLDLHPFTEQARAEGKPLGDYHIPAPGAATTQEPASAVVAEAEAVKEAEAAVKEAADVEAGDDENKKTKGKRGKKNKGKGKSKAEEEAKAKEEEKEVAYELEQGPVDVTSPHLYELFSVIIHCGSSAGFGHYHAYIRDVLHAGHEDQSTTTSTTAEKAKEEEKVEETASAPAGNDDHPLAEKNESGGGGEGATRARWEEMAAEAGRGWYDFNDSTVKPIPVQRLATQYAGRSECAYMLIYRHVPPASGAAETCEGEATRGRGRRVTAPPPVPEHLLAELATYNADLQRERGEYERDRGLIDVMTYHPRHFRLLGGQIHKRIANTTHQVAPGAARGAAAAAAADKTEGASGEERDKKLLTLHKDTTVAQLVKDIKEALGGETEAETDGEAEAARLRLDQVELRGTQLTFSGLSLLLSEVPADATLESVGIKEGSSLSFLLWDGETINGERYDPEAHQINIRVTHYASRVEGQLPAADVDPVVNELVVRLGDMETVSDLKTRIATLTGIPVDKQYLCRIEYQKFTHLAENNIPLIQLGIYNESKVTVELQPVGSERSWAWEMFLRRQKLMEIFVTDKCSGEEPFPTITVEMDKKATLAELKAAVLSKFPSGLMDLNLETQLRRSLPGGGEGTVYADETRTLDETGVKDGDRIIIEHGDASQHVPIVGLRFVVSLSGTKERAVPEPLDIDVPRNATIAKCKEMMCAMFDKPADKSRLRRTDIWGGPDRLFDDERRTLDEAKVLPGDLLWLEDGKPPVRGQIEVFFQLYFRREAGGATTGTTNVSASQRSDEPNKQEQPQPQPQPGDTQKSPVSEPMKNESESEKSGDDAKAKNDREKERLQALRSLVSPAVHLSRSFPPSVREAPDAPFAVSSLFKLDVSRATTVRALKEQLKATAALDHVPSADHIRLWHQERLLKHDRWPLKKHHVANYSTITVEILDSPETSADWREECGVEAAPTANANAGDQLMDDEYEYYGDGDDDVANNNALLLYVHRRDPVRRTIGFVSTLWFGGETVAQLRSEVAQATGIDRAHLQLVKYLQYNGKWRVLDDEVADDTADSVAGAGDNIVDNSKQPATATASDDDEEEDEEEQEDEGTEMVEMTASAATVDGEPEPNSAMMTAEEVAEELKVAAVVAKEEERRERAEADTEAEVLDHRSPYHHEPQQQRGNVSRRKIEGKPYYLKDGDVVVAKDRREEPEGHPDDFHESLCLMPERDFGGGKKKKKRRERGRKDGNWTNQPRGGTTRRAVERGIRIDVDEF